MFKQAGRKRGTERMSHDSDQSDDDISLTSTVPDAHDSDEEFCVENILAEQEHESGEMYYLVEWSGFALHDASWEPESNLGDELKAIWEEKKQEIERGERQPFDVETYHAARKQADKAKRDRHRRRNAKRKRLGLPRTQPLDDIDDFVASIEDDSSDEEAVEDPDIYTPTGSGSKAAEKPHPQTAQPLVTTPLPTERPQPTLPSNNTAPTAAGPKNRSETRRASITKTAGTAATKDTVAQTRKPLSFTLPAASRKQTERTSATGYQGTARKPARTLASATTATAAAGLPKSTGASRVTKPASSNGLKAKKTAVTKQPTGNIFSGGRRRKSRAGLSDVMSDTTREPKMFSKARHMRLAEKGARDKEDRPPDIANIATFEITKGPPGDRRISTEVAVPLISSKQESPSLESMPIATAETGPKKKKNKSVRFLDNDDAPSVQEPEPMDIDSPSNEPSPPPLKQPTARPRLRSPPPADIENPAAPKARLSLAEYRSKVLTQSSDKKLVLGESAPIEVTFNGLPRDLPQQWLSDFLAQETLEFHHSCFSTTMIIKSSVLMESRLCWGPITSKNSEPVLEAAAEYLNLGLLGLYCPNVEYNVLIYPPKCEEWKLEPSQQDVPSPSAVSLHYMIFKSTLDCSSMLRPLDIPSPLLPGNSDSEGIVSTSARESVVTRLFDFSYAQLLPIQHPKQPPVHSFFLAFPETRAAIMLALYHWLRACNPDCQIYICHHPGSWTAFRASAEVQPGAVIVHEGLAWSVRRFPNLHQYLIHNLDEYWCFSEPMQSLPLYPSLSPTAAMAPGDMHFTRIFPYRTAIFLTPSFLVSEPQRAHEFFEWFLSKWAKKFNYRLVTACNIHEYLLDLAIEKSEARDDLWRTNDQTPVKTPIEIQITANLCGLSLADCNQRYITTTLATELHNIRISKSGPHGTEEDNNSLVYADPAIDPNDEQSLVNWFGWWSSLRFDQFRKFHVIGSSPRIKFQGSRRGERRVPIPKYTKATLNDPDAVLERVQRELDVIQSQAETNGYGNSNGSGNGNESSAQAFGNGLGADGSLENMAVPWSFKSDIVQSDDSQVITNFLKSIINGSSRFHPYMTLYQYPVSWDSIDMADHFHDFKMFYKRISDWFSFTWSFTNPTYCKHPRGFNTYLGFFYTIAGEWGPDMRPIDPRTRRHPWIAIYRPVNPHKRPYTKCEVIIWDSTAATRFPGSQMPAEKDLPYMQRQVIQYVRENGAEKNPGTWVDRVWLGGYDYPPSCASPYPIDVTLKFLDQLLAEPREHLPALEKHMVGRGYRQVICEPLQAGLGSARNAPSPSHSSPLFINQRGDDAMDIDSQDSDSEGEDTRIIFHPPRGSRKLQLGQRPKCANKLFENARLARARTRDGRLQTHMTYEFTPTPEWYAEQRAEGRGYEHMNVASWESIFNYFKIGSGTTSSSGTGEATDRTESFSTLDRNRT
ncbi:hypothetical protein B0T22DRAFT_385107 [Podospora appendiculata]|uniref:Chromo domain-containing protein n=1 Tax=Podospora appendiculata TaxID=314037 RepID=A0AAE0X422_9PEZI|nr:hypothetical protein B0T22DRAFT_385107 [Podospora appendiculata]